MAIILDGRAMTDRPAAHSYLVRQLDLPTHYGRNLDALYDVLTEIGEELSISRQAVRDQLKRTEKILQGYEEKLQLVSRFQAQKKGYNHQY